MKLTPEGARLILVTISTCGAAAWLAAVWAYGRLAALRPGESEEIDPGGLRRRVTSWSRLVTGAPEDVAEGLLRVLTAANSGSSSAPGTVSRGEDGAIVLQGPSRLRFPLVPAFSRCEVRVAAAGAGSEVFFRADYSAIRRKARALALVLLALGLLVMAGLVAFLWLKVLPSENPNVRPQVWQAVQMVHFLWPPWLVYALHRYARRGTEAYLDAAASNASVLAEAFAAKRRKAAAG